jgi:general secretion pathway protein G
LKSSSKFDHFTPRRFRVFILGARSARFSFERNVMRVERNIRYAALRRRVRHVRQARRGGFTLVEMLVVLAILGLVVGLVGPRVLNYLSDSKVKTAQIQMENLASALDLYYLDAGRYPTTEEGLGALVRRPANAGPWNGPYLKTTGVPKDPWGRDYLYRAPGQNAPYDVGSLGPEGKEGAATSLARKR